MEQKKQKLVLNFSKIDLEDIALVGGKGANLGVLTKNNIPVPDGFCLTTLAFDKFIKSADTDSIYSLLDEATGDVSKVQKIGHKIRTKLAKIKPPKDVIEKLTKTIEDFGADEPYSVRSSATAEDLPSASFAGQQDTFLNVIGMEDLVVSVKKCWISLFTDRAILYRNQNGFDHREVKLSVIVQKMVDSQKSGILFTADPVSGHRHTLTIDASFGLGEAIVSGIVSPDLYKVDKRNQKILNIEIAEKKVAIYSQSDGGTIQRELGSNDSMKQVLSEEQIIELTELGRRVEGLYDSPQDIEWAFMDDKFYILQSRPITSLYPIDGIETPPGSLNIFMSFGHQQMMTDTVVPFSISVFRSLFPLGKINGASESSIVVPLGGRLYADLSMGLRNWIFTKMIFAGTSQFDALAPRSIQAVMERSEFKKGKRAIPGPKFFWIATGLLRRVLWSLLFANLDGFVKKTNHRMETYLNKIRSQLNEAQDDYGKVQIISSTLKSQGENSIVQLALFWIPNFVSAEIAKRAISKLVPKNTTQEDVEALTLGLSGNVVNEMNLMVGDIADLARKSPKLVKMFAELGADSQDFLKKVKTLDDSEEFLNGFDSFIAQHGSRGPSEIDIIQKKWYEEPLPLLQMVAGFLQKSEGSHRDQLNDHIQKRIQAKEKVLSESRLKKPLLKRMLYVIEQVGGMREHHKFLAIQTLRIIKENALVIGQNLVQSDLISKTEDIWYLSIPELSEVIKHQTSVKELIQTRKNDYQRFAKLNPPLIITSHGESPSVGYEIEDLPEGAMVGNPVSNGVVEGVARVIEDPQEELLNKGEILVAKFTDPGWTPLFINAGGLVLEIGGSMTHGSVVAREYGIPAVVGVKEATAKLEDGMRIRVDGDRGIVEILS